MSLDYESPKVGDEVRFRDRVGMRGYRGGVVEWFDDMERTYRIRLDAHHAVYVEEYRMDDICVLPRRRTWQDEFVEMMADAERARRRDQ